MKLSKREVMLLAQCMLSWRTITESYVIECAQHNDDAEIARCAQDDADIADLFVKLETLADEPLADDTPITVGERPPLKSA